MSENNNSAAAPTIVVTGSREFPTDDAGRRQVAAALTSAVALLGRTGTATLIQGAARGLDSLAAEVAAELGWAITAVPAQWSTHTQACPDWHQGQQRCRMAGHRRNGEMLDMGPDLVVGFPMHPREPKTGSRGTWGCIDAAVRRGLPVVVSSSGRLWLDPSTSKDAQNPITERFDRLDQEG